jgi:hypothetical protein
MMQMARYGHFAIESCDQPAIIIAAFELMKKYLITIKGDARALAREVNRLHAEISTLMLDSVTKAVRAGELLTELKLRVGHGSWRTWVESNLHFSYRTVRRYLYIYNNRDKLLVSGVKTLTEAHQVLTEAQSEQGMDAIESDYARIERDLVKPVRLVRRRLARLTYQGDDERKIEELLATLRDEAHGLLEDLR